MQQTVNTKIVIALLAFFAFSCNNSYTPKPRGFQRFVFPQKSYTNYSNNCGFSFSIPTYAVVLPDFSMQQEKCWFNIYYKPYNATLHLSFKEVDNVKQLNALAEDARTLVYKHTVKADEIYETYIENKQLQGMVYELNGNTASNFQFYVTDSATKYIRGALYFNEHTNIDSITPVLDYLKKDILYMLETLSWSK